MSDIYASEFAQVARLAFSMWNREPASPSFGSFDRAYWGWKSRDFSDATLQAAVVPCVEYAVRQGLTAPLPVWLDGYVDFCARIQHRDGGFDQCYPHEGTPGVVYDMLPALVYVRRSPFLRTPAAQRALDGMLARAVACALKSDERHGEIANHLASYAYALFDYAAHAGDEKARRRGEAYLDRLLTLFDREEGWFQEYEGPDPGYQTRTLRYLVKCARRLDRPELWTVARKAADFLDAVVMPDGTVHAMLGTRSTALVYPSGFEALAARDPAYGALAARVRTGWREGRVPLPSWLDFPNAVRLAEDAREAAAASAGCGGDAGAPVPPPMPAPHVDFSRAGITIFRSPRRVVAVGWRLGGVVVGYGRQTDGTWALLCEDSGYLVRAGGGGPAWVSRVPGAGARVESSPDRLLIRAEFHRSLHEDMTPLQLIVLRLLNLTLLRFQWVGDVFRRRVVRRLMSGRERAPITLFREVRVSDRELRIADRIVDARGTLAPDRRGRLFRCRRVTGTHMASARYWQPRELEGLPLDWMKPVEWSGSEETRCEMAYPDEPVQR